MRHAVVGLATLLLLWASCAPASARTPPLRYFGVGHGAAIGDGSHQVALLTTRDTLELIDYRSRVRRFAWLPRPQCRSNFGDPPVSFRPAETVGAIYGGAVAWSCSYPPDVIVQDIASGQAREVLNPLRYSDAAGGPDSFAVDGLGSNWVALVSSGYHYDDAENYVNWRTGAQAYTYDLHQYADLSSPQLLRRLCSPLVRSFDPAVDIDATPQPYFYAPPYGATVAVGAKHIDPLHVVETHQLVLERCGSRHKRVLDRCAKQCSSVQLSGRLLTWLSGTRARAYDIRRRRLLSWRLPATSDQLFGASVIHLGNRVLVSVPPHPGGTDWTYWSAHLTTT